MKFHADRGPLLVLVLGAGVLTLPSTTAPGEAIRIDLQASPGSFAPAAFGAVQADSVTYQPGAQVWNAFGIEALNDTLSNTVTDPAIGGLLDETGAATAVGFQLTGDWFAWNGTSTPSANDFSACTIDYLLMFSGAPGSFTFTGLDPAETYDLSFTNGPAASGRNFNITIGGESKTSPGGGQTTSFEAVMPDPTGEITGTLEVAFAEGNLAGVTIVPTPEPPNPNDPILIQKGFTQQWIDALTARGTPEVWSGAELGFIGMPVGGIGAGQVYLGGHGQLWYWDIFNIQDLDPGGSGDRYYVTPLSPSTAFEQEFAIKTTQGGDTQVRLLGPGGFSDTRFRGTYPVGTVSYEDSASPVAVTLEAFSPFIPTNADASGHPATVMRYTIANESAGPVEVELVGWLQNMAAYQSAVEGAASGQHVNTEETPPQARLLHCRGTSATGRPDPRPDVLYEDFESDYAQWQVTGTAFGATPMPVSEVGAWQAPQLTGYVGAALALSHNARIAGDSVAADQLTGTLLSDLFTINRDFIRFQVSGGDHADQTEIQLLVNDIVVAAVRGNRSNTMTAKGFDVSARQGQQARLKIVDTATGGWGHLGIDHIVFTDVPPALPDTLADNGSMALALLNPSAGDWIMPGFTTPPASTDGYFEKPDPSGANVLANRALGQVHPGAAGRALTLAPGEEQTVTFVLSWSFPNLHTGRNGLHGLLNMGSLRHHYASRFASAAEVAATVAADQAGLIDPTLLWRDTWYDSTLPYWFLDRSFLNVGTLATTAAYRFTDRSGDPRNEGRLYTWEGVYLGEGTCTHVFHYEQCLGRVFPNLARHLRENVDYDISFNWGAPGVVGYRGEFSGLGDHGGTGHAQDGHAGTILRAYREHTMAPDNAFLQANWIKIKQSIQVLIDQDDDGTGTHDGVLEGAQYNTLDRRWYGRIAWISGLYNATLRAGAAMATEMGDTTFASLCTSIADSASTPFLTELYDGEYFIHTLDPAHPGTPNSNIGCHSDQLIGASWLRQVGLPGFLPETETRSALESMVRYNFHRDVHDYVSTAYIQPARTFADPGESGLIMTTFPKGGAENAQGGGGNNVIAGYASEVWTGQEHHLASHLIAEGMVNEGMALVRAAHERYHPSKRNPYNEIEYGNHYTRAMSSYAPFVSASGFHYHGPDGTLGFAPKLSPDNFKAAFIAAEGWGSYGRLLDGARVRETITLKHGSLRLRTFECALPDGTVSFLAKAVHNGSETAATFTLDDATLRCALPADLALAADDTFEILHSSSTSPAGTDTDGDGLTDLEESSGIDDPASTPAHDPRGKVTDPNHADTDRDGTPDGSEARLGTDPLSSGESFRAAIAEDAEGKPVISWPSETGTSFTVQRSPDLQAWNDLIIGLPGASGMTDFTDTTVPAGADRLFYRIMLAPAG